MPLTTPRFLSRRSVLAGLGGVAAASLLPGGGSRLIDAASLKAPDERAPEVGEQRVLKFRPEPRHLAWVWQFQSDGDPARIRETLAANGLGVVVKTHDATNWMGRYSKSAASGPAGVQAIANYFEQGGVPFHAWAVVRGLDPMKEAEMAADVLDAGARSLFLDLESHDGFWVGTRTSALRFGTELRRRRPASWISTSVDPRPWELARIPLAEFVSFTDELSPQTYWDLFKSPANIKGYIRSGERVPVRGITPAFVVDSAMRHLRAYGRPIHPIGDGTVGTLSAWGEFINQSYGDAAETVSVWRFGVADPAIWRLLRNTPPRSASYLVMDGDTLPTIATRLKTTVPDLVATNTVLAHNEVTSGMRLRVPATAPDVSARASETDLVRAAGVKSPGGAKQRPTTDRLSAAQSLSSKVKAMSLLR